MYLAIPDIFWIPIIYVEKDIFNIKKVILLNKYNYYNNFTNEAIMRKKLTIGVSLPTQREIKWVRDKEAMEIQAEKRGITLIIENADTDVAKQASQVEELLSQNIDILILAPTDSVAAIAMTNKAHQAGVPVIAYDRFIENSDLYVAFDNIRIGQIQGRFLTQRVPKGSYILMSGDPNDRNSKFIKDGAMEYIQPLVDKRDIKIIADEPVINWDPQNAFKIVQDALIAHNNKVDAILAPNDATAGAAIEALQTQGLNPSNIPVTGQDGDLAAAQRIVQGIQAMTIFKDTRQAATVAIDAAIKFANNEMIEINETVVNVSSILLTPVLVTRENLDEVLINSGYLKQNEVYRN